MIRRAKFEKLLTMRQSIGRSLLGMIVLFAVEPVLAQPVHISDIATSVPIMPTKPARPLADGMAPLTSQGFGEQSTQSFIESIKGNDAAFKVIVGQGRLITLKNQISTKDKSAAIAVGDPTIADFQILPNPRLIRVLGFKPGVTDLSITTADDETVTLEVHVVFDLTLLEARIRQVFPSAKVRLAQLREHIIVEGQARSTTQIARIIELIEAFMASVLTEKQQEGQSNDPFALEAINGGGPASKNNQEPDSKEENDSEADAEPEILPSPLNRSISLGGFQGTRSTFAQPRIINLMRVPGNQQVLLKVRIAELNRTALREVGADLLIASPRSGNFFGTRIGGGTVAAGGSVGGDNNVAGLSGAASLNAGSGTTAFGIFPSGDFEATFRLLRQNGVVRLLAEPNLIAMSGHTAKFLAGGEFPVPIPQSGAGAVGAAVTIQFREFGVALEFLPYILEDDRIRLTISPEISTIDFTLGTTLVAGGDPVPGLNTRKAQTTVELNQGQTLAMAGMLQVELSGSTSRIPGLGDLPYIGALFSNTTNNRVEKEMVVLVTPYLAGPMDPHEVPPLPGDSLTDPTDVELYLGGRIEGQTGVKHRSTVDYGPCSPGRLIEHEQQMITGDVGFSE